ncbi:MAG: hypothetical protein ABSC23_12945 [Bryobacteraceae bacterium]|jgi:hypothetical protein
MADSDFWRDLAEKFRALNSTVLLRADWHQRFAPESLQPHEAKWRIITIGSSGRSARYEFEALARRGGREIHPKWESLTAWLEALRELGLNTQEGPMAIETRPDGTTVWHIYSGSIAQPCQASVDCCKHYESIALETERMEALQRDRQANIDEQPSTSQSKEELIAQRKAERKAFADAYFFNSGEKIVVLDMCWAARQRYREWMRWLGGTLKDDTKPDRAFRAVLTSGKRPEEYRPGESRPKGWK